MKFPEVTIIVPIYNGQANLRQTLDSLLSQTFENFELLAIDDGSTDDSGKIVQSFKDNRIRLIRTKNGGLCHALNCGIAESRAPYIARNDQDDISLPQRLERQLQLMNNYPQAIGLFAYNTKFGDKHHWGNSDKLTMKLGEIKEYEPLKDGCLLGSTMFVRVSALRCVGGFRQSYYPCDDYDLECRLTHVGKVLVLCEPLVAYRFHASANTYRMFAEMQNKARWTRDSYERRRRAIPEQTFDEFLMNTPEDRWLRLRQRCKDLGKLHMRVAGQNYLDGHYFGAAAHLAGAVALNPRDIVSRMKRLFLRFA
jgi:glycosyltransferase involved in cell wall biosynthesis